MSDANAATTSAAAAASASPAAPSSTFNPPPPAEYSDPQHVLVASKAGVCNFGKTSLDVIRQLPLPGVVIFVHGVNSDGEWYDAAEQGLVDGLNQRLRRCDEHMACKGVEAGQLIAAKYLSELTDDGFINPERDFKTFLSSDDSFTPIIRFRWGYKPSGKELKEYGANVFLNEQNYWGGGPFANGCSALPDLWGPGLDGRLAGLVPLQPLNPVPGREVYACPPRPYYVLAALRLARLVEALRRRQADVPITIVCHSQGNMIGLAAAFLGDTFEPVGSGTTKNRCVADSYVLVNPPYSLLEKNYAENATQGKNVDPEGQTGRQTGPARTETLAAFFEIVRGRAPLQHAAERIDRSMVNAAHGFTAEQDRQRHGLNGNTFGRATLYCNPHDQVISATSVQGIGWRGLSEAEIKATKGEGVFTQRVFAQGFKIGSAPPPAPVRPDLHPLAQAEIAAQAQRPPVYHYWRDHHAKPEAGSKDFWSPHSLKAVRLLGINALPAADWQIPIAAPPLPEPFVPKSLRFGVGSETFDEGTDAPGEQLDAKRQRESGDPYAQAQGEARGSRDSEAALRYEHHAVLRMHAKRDKLYGADVQVTEEDKPETAGEDYKRWRGEQLRRLLAASPDMHATDHSTILTNPMHSQKALAYDVAVGVCEIRPEDMHELRVQADWRLLNGLDDGNLSKAFVEYFDKGIFKGKSLMDWATTQDSEGKMPEKIKNKRTDPPQRQLDGN